MYIYIYTFIYVHIYMYMLSYVSNTSFSLMSLTMPISRSRCVSHNADLEIQMWFFNIGCDIKQPQLSGYMHWT